MPLMKFSCRDCGGPFELFLRRSEARKGVICPECKSQNVERFQAADEAAKKTAGSSCSISKRS